MRSLPLNSACGKDAKPLDFGVFGLRVDGNGFPRFRETGDIYFEDVCLGTIESPNPTADGLGLKILRNVDLESIDVFALGGFKVAVAILFEPITNALSLELEPGSGSAPPGVDVLSPFIRWGI